MTSGALSLDRQLSEQHIRELTAEVHSFAVHMVELEREAELSVFHGRRTMAEATLERRDDVQLQRSQLLRELCLERRLLRPERFWDN